MGDAERSGIHVTGADSGFPVASAAEAQPHKDGSGKDDAALPKANEVLGGVVHAETEVQLATVTGWIEGTKLTFTFDGQTTAQLNPASSSAAVQTALRNLSNIGPEDVVVSGNAGGPYRIVFQKELKNVDVKQLVATGVGVTEVVKVQVKNSSGGNFKLTFGAKQTGNLPHNASAAEVQAALRGLSSIGKENVDVTLGAGVYTITFADDLAETNVGAITADATGLVPEAEKVSEVTVTVSTPGIDRPIGKVETQVQG